MYKLAIKNAFLFIGAMIGAGFATGAELLVFFSHSNNFTVVLSAILIGALSLVFVYFGKIIYAYPRLSKMLDIIMIINSLITFISMQSGIEELCLQNYNLAYVGLITAIIVSILSAFSLNVTKKLNVLVIPVVICMMFWLFFTAKPPHISGNFQPMQAISYASMNLLLGGYLIAKDSQNMRLKHSLTMSGIITITIAVMLVTMLSIAKVENNHSMPIYAVAITNKLGGLSCIIIYLAILTTIIGAGKVIAMGIRQSLNGVWQGSCFLIVLSVVSHGISFKFMVETFYPITGYVGVIVCGIICALALLSYLKIVAKPKLMAITRFNDNIKGLSDC